MAVLVTYRIFKSKAAARRSVAGLLQPATPTMKGRIKRTLTGLMFRRAGIMSTTDKKYIV